MLGLSLWSANYQKSDMWQLIFICLCHYLEILSLSIHRQALSSIPRHCIRQRCASIIVVAAAETCSLWKSLCQSCLNSQHSELAGCLVTGFFFFPAGALKSVFWKEDGFKRWQQLQARRGKAFFPRRNQYTNGSSLSVSISLLFKWFPATTPQVAECSGNGPLNLCCQHPASTSLISPLVQRKRCGGIAKRRENKRK